MEITNVNKRKFLNYGKTYQIETERQAEVERNDDIEDFEDQEHNVEEREEDSNSEQELEVRDANATPAVVERNYREVYFIGKDNLTRWNKHLKLQNIRTLARNIVPNICPESLAKKLQIVTETWMCFF